VPDNPRQRTGSRCTDQPPATEAARASPRWPSAHWLSAPACHCRPRRPDCLDEEVEAATRACVGPAGRIVSAVTTGQPDPGPSPWPGPSTSRCGRLARTRSRHAPRGRV